MPAAHDDVENAPNLDLTRRAVEYAARGWAVFPCNGKVPLTERGFHDATVDRATIEKWWRRWPDANVAICTGIGSKLVVLDVDGDDGAESLRGLEREHGELPKTMSIKTPSGGSHFYFRHPGGEIRNSIGKLAPGLDVRAEGGYVVAPPSPSYEPDEEAPIAEPPEWLVALICDSSANGAAPKVGQSIPEGKRNATLASLAGAMRRVGMGQVAILAALKVENQNRCKPPLQEPEVGRIAASIGRYAPAVGATGGDSGRAQDGAAFILDAEEKVPAVWGRDGDVAQSQGERLMIVGPQGVGKTALTEQHALRRAGILEGDLLEMPVEVSAGRVLYIAADRPRQAARSFRRMVTEADREALKTGLIVWRGPLPFDLGRCERGDLAEFVDNFPEVTDVYVDALKDCAVKLTDDEVGSRVSNEFAELIAREIEVVVDHHQRKKGPGNAKPTSLADVYGSTWITTGCGSVLLLWGDAGDAIVELSHLKQPAGEVGPLTLVHDHERGTVDVHQPADLYEMARAALGSGLTARSAAMRLYDTSDPDRNQIEKARGRLKRHPKLAIVEGTDPAAWRPM